MRDTLLLVLAAIGGSVLISVACAAMWIAGNACVDWYDRIVAERAYDAKVARATKAWGEGEDEHTGSFVLGKPTGYRFIPRTTGLHPQRHAVYCYRSMDDFHAAVDREVLLRRAGARGESDG